jgi:hypothetical protein
MTWSDGEILAKKGYHALRMAHLDGFTRGDELKFWAVVEKSMFGF